MTAQEAIEALKLINLKSVHPFLSWEEMLEVRDFAIESIEKQIPKKPVLKLHDNRVEEEQKEYYCPVCGEWLTWEITHFKHCYECGQAIDWSEAE